MMAYCWGRIEVLWLVENTVDVVLIIVGAKAEHLSELAAAAGSPSANLAINYPRYCRGSGWRRVDLFVLGDQPLLVRR